MCARTYTVECTRYVIALVIHSIVYFVRYITTCGHPLYRLRISAYSTLPALNRLCTLRNSDAKKVESNSN